MRKIKFRAWDTKHMLDVIKLEWHRHSGEVLGAVTDRGFWNIQDITLMQFTGLKDSQGTEIYEGDVLGFHWKEPCRKRKTTVSWETDGWEVSSGQRLSRFLNDENAHNIKVIGNIHQAPLP